MSEEPLEESDDLPPETAFHLLGHSYRLALLGCLEHYNEPITLADAAEWVACAVEDKALTDIAKETIKRIYMSLYHSHLPKLEAHDVIEYNQEEDMVMLKDADQLIRYRRLCLPAPSHN